ncbi:hypothetical protein [Bdellovibrio sp. BCCA]|uniref:hypothetical protein n=1 Tax=Bdellovibrio sp. BCCA TaxID=3136281 RepID=UPI0030F088A2
MNRLADVINQAVIRRTVRDLGPERLEEILEQHGKDCLDNVTADDGWFELNAKIEDVSHQEFIVDAIAAAMNVDPEHVVVEKEDGVLVARSEMTCGSSEEWAWPLTALRDLEAARSNLGSLSHLVKLEF